LRKAARTTARGWISAGSCLVFGVAETAAVRTAKLISKSDSIEIL